MINILVFKNEFYFLFENFHLSFTPATVLVSRSETNDTVWSICIQCRDITSTARLLYTAAID